MEEKENIQDKKKSLAQSYWIWGTPTFIIIYVLSSGPAVLILRLARQTHIKWLEQFIFFIYFPFVLVEEYKIPMLYDLFKAYAEFWYKLGN